MTKVWNNILKHPLLPKFGVLCVIILGLWLLKPMFNLLVMTLFLTILTYQFTTFGKRYLSIPRPITILIIYGGILSGISFMIYHFWHPALYHVSHNIQNLIGFYSANPHHEIRLFNGHPLNSHTQYEILQWIQKTKLSNHLAEIPGMIIKHIPTISEFGLDIILAFILSLIISLELPTLKKFNQNFYHSELPKFFQISGTLCHQFIQSFTVAIDTQLIISIVNTILTSIGLILLGYHNVWLLSIMVWFLSLIPVAGVLLSFIPLSIIGFANNGIYNVIMVGILLLCVHALESYVLNPQIMANRTRLPVAYTFMALIFGDIYLGIWGLLLAVPLLTFILDFLGVQSLPNDKKTKKP